LLSEEMQSMILSEECTSYILTKDQLYVFAEQGFGHALTKVQLYVLWYDVFNLNDSTVTEWHTTLQSILEM
jgi:hypothetical protein